MQTITSEEMVDGEPSKYEPVIEMQALTEQNYIPNDWNNSKTFDIPRG